MISYYHPTILTSYHPTTFPPQPILLHPFLLSTPITLQLLTSSLTHILTHSQLLPSSSILPIHYNPLFIPSHSIPILYQHPTSHFILHPSIALLSSSTLPHSTIPLTHHPHSTPLTLSPSTHTTLPTTR